MPGESACSTTVPFQCSRRWERYKLNVPVRAIIHKEDRTVIRDGRGTELSEGGMCLMAGAEMALGEAIHVEFTPPYGSPIRVKGIVRNRKGYRYGVEFVAENQQEQASVVQLREALRVLASDQVSC